MAGVLASDLGKVRSLAALDAERMMLLEGDRVIRVVSRSGAEREALVAPSTDLRYTSIVADPHFASTGFVYVGIVELGRDGRPQFNVARYREVDGVLGEGAMLISGLTLDSEGEPSFTLDAAGRIYIAMPGTSARDFYAGRLLRFNDDGSANGTVGLTPVLADGYPRPLALAWAGSTLWMAGGNGESAMLSAMDVGPDARISVSPESDAVASSMASTFPSSRIVGFAAADVRLADGSFPTLVWADEGGRIARARGGDLRAREQRIETLQVEGTPTAVTIGPAGEIYVGVLIGGRSRVVRLAPPTDQSF